MLDDTAHIFDVLCICICFLVGGNDFTTIVSTVTLLSHENQTIVCVNITNDEIPEENESFFCKLNVSPESEAFVEVNISQAVLHIEDNDGK